MELVLWGNCNKYEIDVIKSNDGGKLSKHVKELRMCGGRGAAPKEPKSITAG